MSLRFAYNTNGLQAHRLDDALSFLADTGYDGVALTLDVHHLDPLAPELPGRARELADRLRELELGCVIETGARYLLDPRRKHEPTLVSPEPEGRARRLDFLRRAVDVAEITGAEAVSFWAGVPRPGVEPAAAREWLVDGIRHLAAYADERSVDIALEPEPGHLVETIDDLIELRRSLPDLATALDVGHLLVTGEREPPDAIDELAGTLATVTIDDMRRGEHVHLPFGEGDLELEPVLDALRAIDFRRLVCVELSRDSHRADTVVPATLAALGGVPA